MIDASNPKLGERPMQTIDELCDSIGHAVDVSKRVSAMTEPLSWHNLSTLQIGDAYVTEEFINCLDHKTVMAEETFIITGMEKVKFLGGGRFKRECVFNTGPYSRAAFALYGGPGGHPKSRIVKKEIGEANEHS
jgi:hypothetical protein